MSDYRSAGKGARTDSTGRGGNPGVGVGVGTPGKTTLVDRLAVDPPGESTAASDRQEHEGRPAVPAPVVHALEHEAGTPLPDAGAWSGRVGADVGAARVVTGAGASTAAASIGARAFTVGNRVFLGDSGDPTSGGGDLLAHELTHVAQQRDAAPKPWNQLAITDPGDARETAARSHDGAPARSGELAIARDVDDTKKFVAQWFHDHVVVDNAAIQSIAALPQPQRDAVMAEARRRYGNEFVRRGQAGALPDKPPEDKQLEPLNARDYWAKYGTQTMQLALNRALTDIVFEITGPGLTFSSVECGAFLSSSLTWRMQSALPHHVSQLLDTPLEELIDSVRVLDDLERAPDAFEPAVVERIVERLGLGVRRAVERLALPYAKARSRAISTAGSAGGDPLGPGPAPFAPPPDGDTAKAQPDPGTFGARTTIEHAVAESMCTGFVEFDPDAFPLIYDTAIPGAPRPVKLELERGRGDWLVAHVLEPASATAAEVANALYGNPQFAHLVVGSGARFSYVFPPGKQLAEPYETDFQNYMIDEGASPLEEGAIRGARDPVLGLDDGLADARALDAAASSGAVADGGSAAAVLQRLEIMQSMLDGLVDAATPLGVAPILASAHARLEARRTACAADPAEAQKWAAQSSGQLDLLAEAKTGFDAITQQLFAMGLPAVSTADGEHLVGDVTESMQGPTRELAAAYAGVVAASEQLDIGRERLAIAKERLAAYPFDMVDRMLAVIRKRIGAMSNYATMAMRSYEVSRMDALQAEISTTVGQLRMSVVNGDGTATVKLEALRSQLAMLDLQSTLGSTLSAINQLQGELFRSESMDPDTAREAWIYDQMHAALGEWNDLATDYDNVWKAGNERDTATINSIRWRITALRAKTNLPMLVSELVAFADDEAKRQRWINIAIVIGAALLSIASGGFASGAVGGVAGAIVASGMEALTFTAITSTLNQDQTFGGFIAELGLNFITFGGLRAISAGAKLAVGGRALTLSEKLGEMTIEGLWMVASAKAQEQIEEAFAHGRPVTTQSAATIFGHQMLISFATRVIARVGGAVFMKGISGADKLKEVEAAITKSTEAENLGRQVLTTGDDKLGEKLVKLDTEELKAEQKALERVREIASNPAEAAKQGIELEPGTLKRITADAEGAAREIREREIGELMQHVDVKGDHAIADPAVYSELVAKHRAQGATITESVDAAGQPRATIKPHLADNSLGTPFTLHSRPAEDAHVPAGDPHRPPPKTPEAKAPEGKAPTHTDPEPEAPAPKSGRKTPSEKIKEAWDEFKSEWRAAASTPLTIISLRPKLYRALVKLAYRLVEGGALTFKDFLSELLARGEVTQRQLATARNEATLKAAYDDAYTMWKHGPYIEVDPKWERIPGGCRTGCEAAATQIQELIGGEIKRIDPKSGPTLGPFDGQSHGWAHHEVVVKGDRVYDMATGREGMSIADYKKLWPNASNIEFRF